MEFDTKQEALKEGERIKSLLKTKGWTVYVWENLGWHVSLSCGFMTLYPESTGYSVLMDNKIGTRAGKIEWDDRGNYRSPNAAVMGMLRVVEEYNNKNVNILNKQRKLLGL